MGKQYAATPDMTEVGRESRDGMQNHTHYQAMADELPRQAEFALDVILPVFNLSK